VHDPPARAAAAAASGQHTPVGARDSVGRVTLRLGMSDDESTPPKRRGRPRVTDPGVTLTTYLPQSDIAKIRQKAAAAGVSVSQVMRDLLIPPKPPP
jgi:Ribbon-helix-helix protein, copG family